MFLPPVELAGRSSVDIECCLICWTENSYNADLAVVIGSFWALSRSS